MTITNCNIFNGERFVENQDLTIRGKKISSVAKSDTISTKVKLLVPGFVDLQIYGAGGKLFSAEPSVESLSYIENRLLQEGCTGFLACMATNTSEVFNAGIIAAKAHRAEAKNCLGLHLEGPFLNVKKSGAHVKEYIRKAGLDEIKRLLDFGDGVIKMMTIAPELQDDNVIQYLLDHGVILSLGHSDANFQQASRAYERGIQSTTHLFNAMTAIHHREPGIPTAVFNDKKAMASIIVDGFHVDFEVVKFAKRVMQERLFLITDAVTSCQSGPYQHQLVGDKYVMPDGTLSGSALSMLMAVKNCVDHCDIAIEEAIKMATSYPVSLLNSPVEDLLEPNRDANFVIMDANLNLQEVWFEGEKVN